MAVNLRDRLKRIQESRKFESQIDSPPDMPDNSQDRDSLKLINLGWKQCGYKTLKREINAPSPFKKNSALPPALAVLVPRFGGQGIAENRGFSFF